MMIKIITPAIPAPIAAFAPLVNALVGIFEEFLAVPLGLEFEVGDMVFLKVPPKGS